MAKNKSEHIPKMKFASREAKKKWLIEQQLRGLNAEVTTYPFNAKAARIYKILNKMTGVTRVVEHPKLFIPRPTKVQYERGYFLRYFARQSNSPSAPIIEIDAEQFDVYNNSTEASYYIACAVKWRIRGKWKSTVSLSDDIERKGVVQANKDSIVLAEEAVPGLSGKITNYVKFWRK